MANSRLDRYEGAMLGVAIGDALGAPLEFMSAQSIQRKYGTVREMIGGGWLDVEPGEVTDDTQMTLAVAEGIIESPDSPELAVGRNFLRWYRTNPKDIGGTCRAALAPMNGRDDAEIIDWMRNAEAVDTQMGGMTAGNGALMRTVYPALYYGDIHTAVNIAESIGKMTHWDTDSRDAVREYVRMVRKATSTIDAETMRNWLKTVWGYAHDMKQIIKKTGSHPEPTGYSLASLVCAVNAVMETDCFEGALVYAVNLGGDADTIGAIAGGLAGAVYGASNIPLRWINALANKPNRKTVQLFHKSEGAAQEGEANTLALRLLDLAGLAFWHNRQEASRE